MNSSYYYLIALYKNRNHCISVSLTKIIFNFLNFITKQIYKNISVRPSVGTTKFKLDLLYTLNDIAEYLYYY